VVEEGEGGKGGAVEVEPSDGPAHAGVGDRGAVA
jgi:hypothetical protein